MAISQRFAQTPFASGVVGSLPRPLMVKDMLPETPGPESAEAALVLDPGACRHPPDPARQRFQICYPMPKRWHIVQNLSSCHKPEHWEALLAIRRMRPRAFRVRQVA